MRSWAEIPCCRQRSSRLFLRTGETGRNLSLNAYDEGAWVCFEKPVPLRSGERHVRRREVIVVGEKVENRCAAGGVDGFRHRPSAGRIDNRVVFTIEKANNGGDGCGLVRIAADAIAASIVSLNSLSVFRAPLPLRNSGAVFSRRSCMNLWMAQTYFACPMTASRRCVID